MYYKYICIHMIHSQFVEVCGTRNYQISRIKQNENIFYVAEYNVHMSPLHILGTHTLLTSPKPNIIKGNVIVIKN